jgi:acetyl-CoA carboxylase biotin carboxyl carrier protein
MNLKEIKQLIEQVNSSDLTEFSYSKDGERLVLKKEKELISTGVAAPVMTAAPIVAAAAAATPDTSVEAPADNGDKSIKAPMVGTFYGAPSPDADDFVKVGDTVKVGQVICIIEAMKLMNEIEADAAGVITEICNGSGEPVEYGSPLFKIKPA